MQANQFKEDCHADIWPVSDFRSSSLRMVYLVSSAPMWAQKDAGSIVGTVKDQTGAIVANAKVTVSDVERGIRLETTTNESGEYVAGPLRVGATRSR